MRNCRLQFRPLAEFSVRGSGFLAEHRMQVFAVFEPVRSAICASAKAVSASNSFTRSRRSRNTIALGGRPTKPANLRSKTRRHNAGALISLYSGTAIIVSIQPAIRRQPVQPTLATETAFLVAAERTRRIKLVISIGPHHARTEFVHHFENLAALVRPHARAQAVGDVVRALERLLRRAERHHAQYRSENFLRRHAMRMRDAREKRRRKPKSFRGERALRLRQLRAFVHAALHQLADFFELRPRIDRADVGVLVERIADAQRLDAIAQFLDDLGINSFLHEQPRARATNVALIKINSIDDTFDGLINRRVLEQTVRRLAAEVDREAFRRPGDAPGSEIMW